MDCSTTTDSACEEAPDNSGRDENLYRLYVRGFFLPSQDWKGPPQCPSNRLGLALMSIPEPVCDRLFSSTTLR